MSIGALARATGVSCRTIRYYEELGILPEPVRTDGGTRRYPGKYLGYLESIRRFKELGFTLEEIRDLGELALGRPLPAERRPEVAAVIEGRISSLEGQITELRRLCDAVRAPAVPAQ